MAVPKRTSTMQITQDRDKLLELVGKGHNVNTALSFIGRSLSWYERQRAANPEFRKRIDSARGVIRTDARIPVPDFPEFCDRYLHQPLYRHQLQWVDLLNGDDPRDLHSSQTYEPGDRQYVMVNTPPDHAKSTTLSVNYPVWLLCKNPNIRIRLVSKTHTMAEEFLYAIKQRLTSPRFQRLQADFAPGGSWKDDAAVWRNDRIYLGAERDSGEKDPTIQALGIGMQIYGARADLVLIDDSIVLSNAHQFESQIRWIQQEVITRPGPYGHVMIVGTRVDASDLYKELRAPSRYPSGESPWTYLSQPAVLEYHDDPKKWVTLWPRAQIPWAGSNAVADADGLYPRWDGGHLFRRRAVLAPTTWARAYMQADVTEENVFDPQMVRKCVNGMRQPGLLKKGAVGHRPRGMDGLYVIGSMDPAMVGDTGVIIMAVDRHENMRYVINVLVRTGATPQWILDTIRQQTEAYGVNEWRIEKNAFQSYLTQSPELLKYFAGQGVQLFEHHTGRNKWDVGYGVASMALLFQQGLIELPSPHNSEPMKQLIEQLITWAPETKNKTDLVMALWFASIRASELCRVGSGDTRNFVPNKFLSRGRRARQMTVNLNDLAATSQRGEHFYAER